MGQIAVRFRPGALDWAVRLGNARDLLLTCLPNLLIKKLRLDKIGPIGGTPGQNTRHPLAVRVSELAALLAGELAALLASGLAALLASELAALLASELVC